MEQFVLAVLPAALAYSVGQPLQVVPLP